ncbi:tape measure protein [Pararhodobacter sp.]|uniref:tape measure protein n=1 Tax=Pararhodobacter sp. TaxID=2127056 RepID=UPI002AFE546D|nr:tape measure protein [Pararhodobacter sp.]
MATDVEKLVVQLSADMKQYQREMNRAAGIANGQARKIESRFIKSEHNLKLIGAGMARGLVAPLGGVAAALTTKEVLSYADAWTRAKNSLAVAGVVGAEQVAVLERLYTLAQRNSAPLESLADVYGKAAQAQAELGASTEDLTRFSDVVAMSLRVAGKSAAEASGALTQLGQLLGSSRVQAEEFGSIMEGSQPLLMAVAHGIDAAGGSVSKLKQLVNEGAVSNRDFFEGALRGYGKVASMAANSAQTIDQGMTRIRNAFMKYIGSTDESLSVSQRLVAGLNGLADNFEQTGDVVLKVAAIIAGALVGRAIGGMISNLGLATTAVMKFAVALRSAAGMSGVAKAIGGLTAAAGPLGVVIGATAVGALALFSATSSEASAGANLYAESLRNVESAAKGAAAGIEKSTASIQSRTVNALLNAVKVSEGEVKSTISDLSRAFDTLLDKERGRDLVGMGRIDDGTEDELRALRVGLDDGSVSAERLLDRISAIANADSGMQWLVDELRAFAERAAHAKTASENLSEELKATPGGEFARLTRELQVADAAIDRTRERLLQYIDAAARAAQNANILPPDAVDQVNDLRDALQAGEVSADDARGALEALGRAHPKFGGWVANLAQMLTALQDVTGAANDTRDALSRLGQGAPLMDDAVAAWKEASAAGKDFMADLAKRNSMTREAIDLEKKIVDLRKEAKARGATNLTDADFVRLAKEELAAEMRRGSEGKKQKEERADEYQRAREDIQRNIADMELEISVFGKSAYAIEFARAKQELLNAAKAAGRAETADLIAEVEREAAAYATVAQRMDEAGQKQQDNLDLQRELGNHTMTSLNALIRGTSSWNDVLGDTLDLLGQMVLKAALLGEGPLASMMGGGKGGLLGTLMGGLTGGAGGGSIGLYSKGGPVHAATGGRIAGPGTGTSDSIPAMLSNGEYVVKATAARKHAALLDAINSGSMRYLSTGGVAGRVRAVQANSAPGAPMSISAPLHIDARGANMTAEQMRAAVAPMFAEHTRQLQQAVPSWVEAQRGRTMMGRRT